MPDGEDKVEESAPEAPVSPVPVDLADRITQLEEAVKAIGGTAYPKH